jgi:hypothetical protein
MIVGGGLWRYWDSGGSVPPPTTPPGGGGYVRFSGNYPSWLKKRLAIQDEAKKYVERKKKRIDTSKVAVDLVEDFRETELEDIWADLGQMLQPYGSHLTERMTALNLFLLARNAQEARDALRKLQIQLEDEIILIIAANT